MPFRLSGYGWEDMASGAKPGHAGGVNVVYFFYFYYIKLLKCCTGWMLSVDEATG